jgi:KinB signaling pathway activation protein
VTSRNWVKLFFTTLLIGSILSVIVGLIVRWSEFQPTFTNFHILEILSILTWLVGVGMIFSLISQAGFFAYLTVHRFGVGIFRSASLWNVVQALLILFVLFDLVYLRYSTFAKDGESLFPYIGIAFIVLAAGLVTAYVKMRQTTQDAFIPSLFFMVVVTVLEWVPVLRVNESSWLYLMLFPLLACNAYQILVLHKLNEKSQVEREQRRPSVNVNYTSKKQIKREPSK